MDVFNSFSKLDFSTKRILLNLFVIFTFWAIPFILFKPEIIDAPIYVQFFLVFTFTVLWSIITLLFSIKLTAFKILSLDDSWFLEISSFFGINFLCVYILIGYYYSVSFTDFLKVAFIPSVTLSYGIPTIATIISLICKTKVNKSKNQEKKDNMTV